MDVEAVSESNVIIMYVLVWRVGLKQLFMQVYLYNEDTEGSYWSMQQMCSTT